MRTTCVLFEQYFNSMDSYVKFVKNWYQTGQEIINNYNDGGKKAALVKIDKTATMHQAKCFSNSNLDVPKCIRTMVELIYLLNQGINFTTDEGTQLFFSITKLLQSADPSLRRAVYVYVKQMRQHPSIYIVTSSLLKDIHHKDPNFRRNSLRTIPLIVDASNLSQIQRYIKALIVDPDVSVSSAALLSGIQMFQTNEELVKKWGTEVMEKLTSKDQYVQASALMLVGDIKRKDANSYKKILFSLMKQSMNGIAAVQYLRMLSEISKDLECDAPQTKDFINYINREVRNKEDMVQIEACRLACQSSLMANKDLLEVVKILQTFLVSESTVKKYSVLKIFNSLLKNPFRKSLIVNVKQIEKVLNDNNTSLSSIAASILLRICSEGYLETLFTRIQKTMSEMSVEYKRDVVRSLINVLKAYPKKYDVINRFLLAIMRKEESCEIKSQAIEVMNFQITELGGAAKTECILELTRFLSATQYHRIHFQILGIVSRQAGKQEVSSELFKNIISQIYLQQGAVRACGLSTLIKLSQHQQKQRDALQLTIEQFKNDSSLEVRERLLFRQKDKPLSSYELDIIENYLLVNAPAIQSSNDASLLSIEAIKKWGAEAGNNFNRGKTVPKQIQNQIVENDQYQTYRQIFENHPTFKSYGTLRKINKSMQISDSDSELYVNLRLFLFDQAFIGEFKIINNITGTILENLKIEVKHSGENFETLHITPAKIIAFGQTGQCFVGIKKIEDCDDLMAEEKFNVVAKYTVKEMSGETVKKSYNDQFSLEGFEIKIASYMAPWVFQPSQFEKQWNNIKVEQEKGTFQLKYASTQAAEQQLIRHFGLRRVESMDGAAKPNMVVVNLAGKYLGSSPVLLMLILAYDTKLGCLLKIRIKTSDEDLTNQLLASIS